MSSESVQYTSFVTQDGQYEYVRMPFGLCNAPAVFQRMINRFLGQYRFSKVLCYLDDILLPAVSLKQSMEVLRDVLETFKTAGLTLNLSKCFFLREIIEYLGYRISASLIQPSRSKIEAVKGFPAPGDVHHVRQFLGLTGYFRKLISGYAEKSKPLTALLHKDAIWVWGTDQERAFKLLQQELTSEPVLRLFDPTLKTRLYTDASRIGLAGILVQVKNGKEFVVSYFSRHTTTAEQKYHSFELETLAIVASVKRFRQYLLGIPFMIFTDCAAVRSTFLKSEINARVGRWVLELSQYQYDIKHKGNQQMRHVDALSRNLPSCEQGVCAVIISQDDWLLAVQQDDKGIVAIKRILESGDRQGNKDVFENYTLKSGKVHTSRGARWVVPKLSRFQLLRMAHDDSGHVGVEKTYEVLAEKFWFRRMRRFVTKNCLNCLFFKSPAGKPQGYLHPIRKVPQPFHTVHVDHLGPFVKTKNGNVHILVIIDAFTKFILLQPVKSTQSRYVISSFREFVKLFGTPKRIISDRGKAFDNKAFHSFCRELAINHHLNATAMPQGNGQVERYNRVLLDALSTMGADKDDNERDRNLMNIQLGINGTLNKTIGVTPSEALMGFRVCSQSLMRGAEAEEPEAPPVDVTAIRKRMVERTERSQSLQKERYDQRRREPRKYVEGDLVLIRVVCNPATGQSQKLLAKWRGPFKVTKVLMNDRYEV
ncbi:hypothetical protein MTP99_014326 [Tenebrio molitor]|jgi:transposase InsO family protein|nr:hypothetical protein MTP99_014326 [Tenebrio molitor]CAH1372899.1 unnamed protein product [Tenebrio molitor]